MRNEFSTYFKVELRYHAYDKVQEPGGLENTA